MNQENHLDLAARTWYQSVLAVEDVTLVQQLFFLAQDIFKRLLVRSTETKINMAKFVADHNSTEFLFTIRTVFIVYTVYPRNCIIYKNAVFIRNLCEVYV